MRVMIIGEAMLEYRSPAGARSLAFGGDTLNTAIHLARLGAQVSYVTALGSDPMSESLRAAWQAEGIDTRFVLRHPRRQPGIYAIQNDAAGERSFLYWRSDSAARDIYSLPEMAQASEAMAAADLLYFSLISLAILPTEGRQKLLGTTRQVRLNGGRVAFDGNFRSALWGDRKQAIQQVSEAAFLADYGLPTWSDEMEMRAPDPVSTAQSAATHWLKAGAREVAVKTGLEGCLLATAHSSETVRPPETLDLVDSSGAGDAFNAGYLMARMHGLDAHQAALAGHRLAGWVIQRPGAIPPIDELAPYAELMRELPSKE